MNRWLFMLLLFVLPVILPLLVIVPAAIAGITRWRRTLLIVALVSLGLFLFEFLILGVPFLSMTSINNRQFDSTLWMWVFSLGVCYTVVSMVGVLLALFLAARLHMRRWFNTLLAVTIISALAGSLACGPLSVNGPYAFTPFLNTAQATAIYYTTIYHIIIWALTGLVNLMQLLYALIGLRGTASAATSAFADEVTLP